MTQDQNDQLDDLLQHWAGRRSPTESDIEVLCGRISASLDSVPLVDAGSTIPQARRIRVLGPIIWFSFGAAVALLVSFLLQPATPGFQPQQSVTAGNRIAQKSQDRSIPPRVVLDELHPAGKAVLLAEMERLFANRLIWIVETGREVHLGLTREVPLQTSRNAPMLVRVTVVARRGASDPWEPIRTVDIVTYNQQMVDFAFSPNRAETLHLWTYSLDDGLVAADTDLVLEDNISLRFSSSEIQKEGAVHQVFAIQAEGVEYRAYQTVIRLNESGSVDRPRPVPRGIGTG